MPRYTICYTKHSIYLKKQNISYKTCNTKSKTHNISSKTYNKEHKRNREQNAQCIVKENVLQSFRWNLQYTIRNTKHLVSNAVYKNIQVMLQNKQYVTETNITL